MLLTPLKIFQYLRVLIKRTLARLRARGGFVTINTKNGYPMTVDAYDPGLSLQLIVNGKREVQATDYFETDLEEGMTLLECGANIGYYTLLALRKPKTKVIAFEPVTENVVLLKKNLLLNNVSSSVTIFPYAAGDKTKVSPFYVSTLSNAGNMVCRDKNTTELRTVKTVKLDTFLKKKDRFDYLRMDVEGYELNIIQGMKRIFSTHPPKKLFIEIHPTCLKTLGSSITVFIDLLFSYGYVFNAAFYEGAALIAPKKNHAFFNWVAYRKNSEYETRSAQVFFTLKKTVS